MPHTGYIGLVLSKIIMSWRPWESFRMKPRRRSMTAFQPVANTARGADRGTPSGMRDVPRATPQRQEEEPPAPVPQPAPRRSPLRAIPPDDVPKRFTSFRLPIDLDEELRAMMFETRRSKQDLLTEFVTAGVQQWRRNRSKR